MENRKLFKKLDHLRPRIEQLKTYIELLENRFPLPLYVKLPDGSHKITRRLADNMQVEVVNKVSSLLPEGNKKFPLSLFLRDQKGEYRVSNILMDGYTVEGIALRDTIILRETHKPKDIDKENPTVEDLNTLAKNVHPLAEPIYWKGFWGGGLVTLLMVDRKHYNQTAEMLRKHGVIMPNINGDIPFVGAALKSVDGLNDRVSLVYFNHWIGASTIASVKEVMLAIPREKVDPIY